MSNVISLAEQIERLEVFQELTAQQQIEQLQDRIEELESQPADITAAIRILTNHTASVIERQEQAELIEHLEAGNHDLHEQLKTAVSAAEQAIRQRDHYQDQCEKLLKKHNGDVDKANVTIKQLQAQLKAEQAEVKRLRSLAPEKLAKQIKQLQKKNKELTEGNGLLNKRVSDLKHHQSRNKELAEHNQKLLLDNRALDQALAQMCDAHNDQSKTLISDLGNGWQIHTSADSTERLTVLDTTTDCARQYVRGEGVAKVRPLPKAVIAAVEKEFEGIAEWRANAVDYAAMGAAYGADA